MTYQAQTVLYPGLIGTTTMDVRPAASWALMKVATDSLIFDGIEPANCHWHSAVRGVSAWAGRLIAPTTSAVVTTETAMTEKRRVLVMKPSCGRGIVSRPVGTQGGLNRAAGAA